jgi:hypothetical protein
MASASSTSSSIILSNVLATESCELRTAIDSYMDTKLKELQEIMKTKVDSVITGRLDKFYNKSFEDHDKILFDSDGLQLINEYNSNIKGTLIPPYNRTNEQIKKDYPLYPLLTENCKCFTVAVGYPMNYGLQNNGLQIRELSFFKTFIIERNSEPPYHPNQRQWRSSVYKHNLSTDCLFAIKHFQAASGYVGIESRTPARSFTESIKLLEEHPEYFKKNCSEFEGICRREYAEIEKMKKQLKSLMDENMSKKDYYASLDKKNKDFEQEKKQLEEERQKLKEEKEKMVFIKEKLVEMKKEVELEKQKILEQKSKTIDIDKCFEDIISFNFISEMPKNKVGPKVAYD